MRRSIIVALFVALTLPGPLTLQGTALAQPQLFLGFSSSGEVLGVGTGRSLRLFDTRSGRRLWSIEDYLVAAFLPRNDRVVVQTQAARLQVRDAATGKLVQTLSGGSRLIGPIVARSDGMVLAAAAESGLIYVWDLESGRLTRALKTGARHVRAIEVAADGGSLAVGIEIKRGKWDVNLTQVWDLTKPRVRREIPDAGFRLSPDGRTLYTWGSGSLYEGVIRVWNAQTASRQRVMDMDAACDVSGLGFWGNEILAIEFSGCSEHFVSGVSWWDARTFKRLGGISEFQSEGSFSLTETPWVVLFRAREAGAASVTDVRSKREGTFSDPDFGGPLHVALSPGARLIAGITGKGVVYLWDVASEKLLFSVPK